MRHFETTGELPPDSAVKTMLRTVEAQIALRGERAPLGLRTMRIGGDIYVDLGDGRVVQIDRHGWRVSDCLGVHFRRPSIMRPLPPPRSGGALASLSQVLNIGHR